MKSDLFIVKLRKYDNLLWHVARKYEIRGVLLREDLYQEALIVLDEIVAVDDEHVLSETFAVDLRCSLKYRLSKARRHHIQRSRDWRKSTTLSDHPIDNSAGTTDGSALMGTLLFLHTHGIEEEPGPEQIVIEREERENAARFVKRLLDSVDESGRQVITALLSTDEPPSDVVAAYKRVPKHMSQRMLAQLLGWDRSKVQRTLDRLCQTARKLEKNGELHKG